MVGRNQVYSRADILEDREIIDLNAPSSRESEGFYSEGNEEQARKAVCEHGFHHPENCLLPFLWLEHHNAP